MPQVTLVQQQRNFSYLKQAAVAVGGVLVLFVAAWVAVAVLAWQKHDNVVKQDATFKAAGNTSAEATLLSNYINSKPPQAYRFNILVRLGDLAYAQHQFAAAAGWYFQAYRINGHDENVLVGMAQSSAGIGDKQTAIAYYKKAVDLEKQHGKSAMDPKVEQYQSQIIFLGGRP